jgi:photosystem II stability/assembly factor-like uncharacterized protein
VLTNGLYWFAGGLTVTPEGAAISSQDAYEQDYNGNVLLYVLRSEDGGRSWSRVPIVQSRQGRRCSRWAECGLGFLGPQIAIAAADRGDVRVAWMDNRTGRWNTWYRRSADGGRTWSGSVRLSDRPDGAPYKSPRGFRFPYGDYGQLDVDGRGRTHAAWGEGPNDIGPGGAWHTHGPLP